MASNKNQNVLHIAMFPWLAHGHIMPFFELSKFLAQKGHKISFISTPKNLNRLIKSIPQNLSHLITLVPLPLPHVEGLPQGTESTSELPIHKVPFLKRAYDKLQLGLTQFLKESQLSWIVLDFASYLLPRVATELGIKSVHFSILGATSKAFFGPPSEMLSGNRRSPEDFTVVPKWIDFTCDEGVAFKLYEITSHWNCMDSEAPDSRRAGEVIQGCQFVVTRTCPEFESNSLNLLGKLYGKPVLPIGFLPPTLQGSDSHNVGDKRWEGLKQWLDNKEENSVVYIALGTEVSLSQDLMHELAHGIEKSGLPFIWVVNDRLLVEGMCSDIIPLGFETRVLNRGLVWRGWAPQLEILGHSSVGGFLTHCGWSSVIEALGFGRALILLPGGSSDLGLVSRLLHSRKIGLEIPRDDKTGSFTSDSVAESIRRVMVDQEGEPLRAKARSMREIFGNAELQNKYLNEFAEFLLKESAGGSTKSIN